MQNWAKNKKEWQLWLLICNDKGDKKMKNFEKYFEELYEIGFKDFAIVENKPDICNYQNCAGKCRFSEDRDEECMCNEMRKKWLLEEYIDSPVYWNKVKVDTPILVSNDNKKWYKRYFAKFENGNVYAWRNGATSWSTEITTDWKYAKLAENEI